MKALEDRSHVCPSPMAATRFTDATKPGRSLRCQLSAAAQDFLWSIQESRSYSPRTAIFRMGDPPEGVFLLESGEVGLWLERPWTYPLLLRTASAGEALGLSACVSGYPYEATAISISPCEVAFVSTEQLAKLVERVPEAWVCIAQSLSAKLAGAYGHVTSMRSTPFSGKR
jgi:CRP-like cAMP-binding protein